MTTLPQRREFLRRTCGVLVSDSMVSRTLKRLGWTRKKIGRRERTRRVLEGGLARHGRREHPTRAFGLRRGDENQHLAGAPLRLVAAGERARFEVTRNWGANVTLLASMSVRGIGPCLAVEGPTTKAVFEAYLERVLAPSLGL